MRPQRLATWSDLVLLRPAYALVGEVDLVIIRGPDGEDVSVLYGRCLHRGALLADGMIVGRNLVCGLHDWDYRYDTGVSEYHHNEVLRKFTGWIEDDAVKRWSPDGGVETVIADPRIAWPDSFALGADGGLYVTTSQIHRGPNPPEPYRILRITGL